MNDNITKKDVIACISKERKSSFLNHFLTFFSNDRSLFGEINERTVLLWFNNGWIGAYFPVFSLEFNDQQELINISYTKNWLAKFLDLAFNVFIILFLIDIFSGIDYPKRSFFLPSLFLTMVFIFKLLFYNVHKFEYKNQLEDLYNGIGIKQPVNDKPKKKSFFQVIILLTFIPLSLLFFVAGFFYFKDGYISEGVFAVLVGLVFLTSRLLFVFKKRK